MKSLFFIFALLVSGISFSQNYPIYNDVAIIDRYDPQAETEKTVLVQSPFARPELTFPEGIDWSDKEITGITYLYSKNNHNPGFAQNKLSDQRYENLLNGIPEISSQENIKWNTLVQGGCRDNDCTKGLYHGFIITYRDKKPEQKYLPFEDESISTQHLSHFCGQENVFQTRSGVLIHVPADAFVDTEGEQVGGYISIIIKEALTAEDIVLGNLYTLTDDHQPLMSKGMLEVTAEKDGNPLELADGKLIHISVPTGYSEGYSFYQGERVNGDLRWKNPSLIKRFTPFGTDSDRSETNEANVERERDIWLMESIVSFKRAEGEIAEISISMTDGVKVFTKDNFNFSTARQQGLNTSQYLVVKKWFKKNYVLESELIRGNRIKNLEIKWNQTTTTDCIRPRGYNFGMQDPDLVNVFSMEKLGWANIDRLASLDHTKKIRLHITQRYLDQPDQFSISMIVPSVNIYLPGYQREDGNYCFTHGDYEDLVKMPVGETAYIIGMGEKDSVNFFQMKEITLGDNELEHLHLKKMDKKEALAVIRETL